MAVQILRFYRRFDVVITKRWIGFCIFTTALFLLVDHHCFSRQKKILNDFSSPISDRHKIRNDRIAKVCRTAGHSGKMQPAVFVTPSDRYNSFPGASHPMAIDAEEIPITSHYHLASGYQTMGCLINKVASSSFVAAFLKVQEISESMEDDPYQAHFMAQQHLLPKVSCP